MDTIQQKLQAYKVDYIVDCYLDVISKFYMGLFTQDEDARPKIIDDLFNIHLPKIIKLAEDQLKTNGGKKFLFGDKLTIADFYYG